MANDLEKRLIKKALAGDSHAFEQLIIPYEKKVYNIAYQMFRNEYDAADAAQEVFLKVYRNLGKFGHESAFSTWLHRLAMNTCIDEYRKKKRHLDHTTVFETSSDDEEDRPPRQYESEDLGPLEKTLQKETVLEVRKALEALKEDQKMILIYRDIQGFSYEEISDMMNLSLGTVKSRIARARMALKDIILNNRQILGELNST